MLNVTISAGSVVNGNINVTLSYDGMTYPLTISVTTVSDGEQGHKGEVGATMRGPQSWTDLGIGYTFESGGDGDEWKDVVIYGSTFYSCIRDHVKTATNYPGSDEDINNKYWRAGSPFEMIATQIMLSKFAFIENLGAEGIKMYSHDGKELLFEAYDGKLTCKTGTFENVKISGEVNATKGVMQNVDVSGDIEVFRLRYRSNRTNANGVMAGSFISGSGKYILPHLDADEHMKVVVANPVKTRATPPVELTCEGDKDVFLPANGSMLTDATTSISAYGWCEIIGIGSTQQTIWMYNIIKE